MRARIGRCDAVCRNKIDRVIRTQAKTALLILAVLFAQGTAVLRVAGRMARLLQCNHDRRKIICQTGEACCCHLRVQKRKKGKQAGDAA